MFPRLCGLSIYIHVKLYVFIFVCIPYCMRSLHLILSTWLHAYLYIACHALNPPLLMFLFICYKYPDCHIVMYGGVWILWNKENLGLSLFLQGTDSERREWQGIWGPFCSQSSSLGFLVGKNFVSPSLDNRFGMIESCIPISSWIRLFLNFCYQRVASWSITMSCLWRLFSSLSRLWYLLYEVEFWIPFSIQPSFPHKNVSKNIIDLAGHLFCKVLCSWFIFSTNFMLESL